MDKVRKYFLVTVNDNTLPIYFTEFCSKYCSLGINQQSINIVFDLFLVLWSYCMVVGFTTTCAISAYHH
jgi:hypothetical protein